MSDQFSAPNVSRENPLAASKPVGPTPPAAQAPEKKVERVVTEEVKVRKKGIFQRWSSSIFKTDLRTLSHAAVSDIIAPALKNTVVDAIQTTVAKAILGENANRPMGMSGTFRGGFLNQVNYAAISAQQKTNTTPQVARPVGVFDPSIYDIGSRAQAEEVVLQLDALITEFGLATVADLKAMLGISAEYTDQKWGWNNLAGANVRGNTSSGFFLDLPPAQGIR